jgi:hypothetical protein
MATIGGNVDSSGGQRQWLQGGAAADDDDMVIDQRQTTAFQKGKHEKIVPGFNMTSTCE